MLKIIILLALFAAVEPTLEQFLGEWVLVMIFPDIPMFTLCPKYQISKDPSNIQCSCEGDKNTTLVRWNSERALPFLEVANTNDVTAALNTSCKCGEKNFKTCLVGRPINEEHKMVYNFQNKEYYMEEDRYTAHLLGRRIENIRVITDMIVSDEELMQRRHRGGYRCNFLGI